MKIEPVELEERGFVLLDKLEHDDLIPFIQKYLRERTRFSILYLIFNVICFFLIALHIVFSAGMAGFSLGMAVIQLSYGFIFAFGIIPIHEYIHVLAYRSQGASKTSYLVRLSKFYFLAVADGFVANKKEFSIVALAPFVIISACLIVAILLVPWDWKLTLIGALFLHTACCSGDFALLSYLDFHKDKSVVTYDDAENKVSYFYTKQNAEIPVTKM